TSLGVSSGCGRTRRYFNSYWRNYRRWKRTQGAGRRSVHQPRPDVSTTRSLGTQVDWNLAWEVLVTLGGGDAKLLNRVTRQFDPSARFFHELVATLEDMGHIEIQRDLASGEIETWETAPTTVVDDGNSRRLIGHWSGATLRDLARAGIKVHRQAQP